MSANQISKAVVTGGAGFIGSRLVDSLAEDGIEVVVADNLSTGLLTNIRNLDTHDVKFVKVDCELDPLNFCEGADVIFHLAGNPEVRAGFHNTAIDFSQNILATYRMLEGARRYRVPRFVFTSTSTVYGEPLVMPTPENYSPLQPISTYGGSKLACEAMISAFSHMFSMESIIFRFANVVGPMSRHGVIYDFVRKLAADPSKLEVLGDGTQRKSYIDIEDCVDAMLYVLGNGRSLPIQTFNLGSSDSIDVLSIANIVAAEMGLAPRIEVTGGVDGGRGWFGDVKTMHLDTLKIRRLGWTPKYSSAEAVTRTASAVVKSILPQNDMLAQSADTPGRPQVE
jgi:UDP-glucose 4-epimerase